jgi:hypothetical protein
MPKHRKTRNLLLCFSVLVGLLCFSVLARSARAQYKIIYTEEKLTESGEMAKEPIDFGVKVSAIVPYEWWLELHGWTSPGAQVEFTMEQVIKKITTADDQGQFTFRVALPRTIAPFCLIAQDISGISSHPLCIAPPPPEFNILIKEVVMPPTLKVDEGKLAKGETVPAQGYTTPNSEVIPYLFEEKGRPLVRLPLISESTNQLIIQLSNHLVSPALAVEVPKFPIKSDQNGFFQFNLPSETLGKNRLFVGSFFHDNPSPKSTTLVFDVLSWWRMLLERLMAYCLWLVTLFLGLLTRPEGIIFLELGIIGIVIYFIVVQRKKQLKQEAFKD